MALSRNADVVVVGAGIAGLAAAWQLAVRGVQRVVVVDRRPPLTLTSNRPEANYRTWWPQPAMVRLARRSLDLIAELQADGADIPMNRRGYLYVSDVPASAAALRDLVAAHPATVASDAAALGGDELRRRWPHLAPSVLGGIFVGNAGGLNTVALGQAMLERAQRRGVEIVNGRLTSVAITAGRVVGADIESRDGMFRISADAVVNAAGPYARNVAQLAAIDMPLETVVRHKLVVDDRDGLLPRDAPFTISIDPRSLPWTSDEKARIALDPALARLLRPMPAGIHVKPDESAGARAIKLGWAWDQTPTEPVDEPPLSPDFPRIALLGASTLIPGLRAYGGAVAHEGGFYARTPDGMPLVGRVGAPGLEGFCALAGLAGFGAMMAAAAGEILADIVTGSPAAEPNGDFDPGRFANPAYDAALASGGIATGEL